MPHARMLTGQRWMQMTMQVHAAPRSHPHLPRLAWPLPLRLIFGAHLLCMLAGIRLPAWLHLVWIATLTRLQLQGPALLLLTRLWLWCQTLPAVARSA